MECLDKVCVALIGDFYFYFEKVAWQIKIILTVTAKYQF